MVRTHATWYARQIFNTIAKLQVEALRVKPETPPPCKIPTASISPYEKQVATPK